jgi:superfamily II DNA or RNA helicase
MMRSHRTISVGFASVFWEGSEDISKPQLPQPANISSSVSNLSTSTQPLRFILLDMPVAMSSPKNQYLIVRYDRPHAHDTEESISDRRLPEYDSLVQAVNIRLESLGFPWRIKTWQAAVAAECLAGRDVVVKAQTGSGKSMCYYSLAMLHPKDCILVICPLLALMADQVNSAGALGIKAVQLSAATMKEDPNLLNKVRGGEFSIVFVAAEFTAGEGWRSLILDDRTGRKPNFAQSLRRIIIDEAHLVREWRVFRPHYRNLGLLRTRFPRVPIMACSATLPKATLAYIHKSLYLERPTVLCDMPTDRPNITLFTAPIPKGQPKSMTPLLDLVPKELVLTWNPEFFGDGDAVWNPWNIPKTLVFIDDKNACCTLTTQLINQFPEHLRRSDARDIISKYHTTMSRKALQRNLQALRDGTCRIMVCTDAVGMGLDVPDIQRILQWRVPPWLTVSGWMQRAGRAARNPEIAGIATIYYDPSCTVEAESPFLGRAQVEEELEAVHNAIKACTPEDAEDVEIRPKKKKGSLPCEAELLWYINTKGCIREVAMHYLGSKPEPRAAFDEHEQGSPCCCRCYKESGNAPDDFAGFPVRTCTPFLGSDADPEVTADTIGHSEGDADGDADAAGDDTQPANFDHSQSIAKVSPVSRSRIRLAVCLALDIWRHQELSKQQAADRMLRAKHILSDSMIAKLEAKCLVVKQAVDVTSTISGPDRDVLRYTRIANNTAELAEVIVQVVSSATAPNLPYRARNAPFTPGEPKPMFSETDIDGASNPKVAQMMRNANQELRQFDIVSVNAKETARLKRNASSQLRQLIFGGSQPAGSIVSATESDAGSIAQSVFSQDVPNSQQTDRDLMPPPSLPVKRGRGRPRKTPLMEPSVASTASDASDGPPRKKFTPQVSSDEAQIPPESESLNEEPIKRGRGRPRGSKNRRPSSPAEKSIKRARGRPRVSQNPPEQQSPSHSNDQQPEQSDAPDDKDAAMET